MQNSKHLNFLDIFSTKRQSYQNKVDLLLILMHLSLGFILGLPPRSLVTDHKYLYWLSPSGDRLYTVDKLTGEHISVDNLTTSASDLAVVANNMQPLPGKHLE